MSSEDYHRNSLFIILALEKLSISVYKISTTFLVKTLIKSYNQNYKRKSSFSFSKINSEPTQMPLNPLTQALFELKDDSYREFHAKLIPNVPAEKYRHYAKIVK